MEASYHRHDVSNKVWSLLENLLPGRKGMWGGNAVITDFLLMLYFGYGEQVLLGVIYHLTMGIGKILTGDSAGGATKVLGNLSCNQ